MTYRKILIIGAGRSGTNMLRDVLTAAPGVATWPCDEINYVWRHGNREWPDDEIPPSLAGSKVRRFINRSFDSAAGRSRARVLVEKTCANSMRVPFVNEVVPDARYVFLVRDGRDAAASAMKRWTGTMTPLYIMRKARFVPLRDIPYYGTRFLKNKWKQRRSAEGRLDSWGPRFSGFDEYVRSHTLAETCAMQWVRSVDLASSALQDLSPTRWIEIRYEDLVNDPVPVLRKIASFAEIPNGPWMSAANAITSSNIGKWKKDLAPADLQQVEDVAGYLLRSLGYCSGGQP